MMDPYVLLTLFMDNACLVHRAVCQCTRIFFPHASTAPYDQIMQLTVLLDQSDALTLYTRLRPVHIARTVSAWQITVPALSRDPWRVDGVIRALGIGLGTAGYHVSLDIVVPKPKEAS